MPCAMAAVLTVLTTVRFDTTSDREDVEALNQPIHKWLKRRKH